LPPGILLDIEGTTSSVSFVYDRMFPFVRRELRGFLAAHADREDVGQACEQIARDAGHASFDEWVARQGTPAQELVAAEVLRLMDGDVKATGLKQLQGLIWHDGFLSGELQAHVYDDVLPCLQRWHAAGHDIRIYSSGSVQAQRLFFGHTIVGDLLPYFRGHYDTTRGSKREAASYAVIAADFALPPSDILFLSDLPAELDAARDAGLPTCLVCRPGNASIPDAVPHRRITSFTELS
jgi:enolase-phosphatase E1